MAFTRPGPRLRHDRCPASTTLNPLNLRDAPLVYSDIFFCAFSNASCLHLTRLIRGLLYSPVGVPDVLAFSLTPQHAQLQDNPSRSKFPLSAQRVILQAVCVCQKQYMCGCIRLSGGIGFAETTVAPPTPADRPWLYLNLVYEVILIPVADCVASPYHARLNHLVLSISSSPT